jgi:hypothetical protein
LPIACERAQAGRGGGGEGDERSVALLVEVLGLDQVDLFVITRGVKDLLGSPLVNDAIRELGSALLEHGALPGSEVRRIVTEAGVEPCV